MTLFRLALDHPLLVSLLLLTGVVFWIVGAVAITTGLIRAGIWAWRAATGRQRRGRHRVLATADVPEEPHVKEQV
ncbi:hypothetical protein [Streptomyces iconiensis]|uniref:Uncharacterized protein n=1 Tax=Streptomyces iconiensis TaxID=1384038 RepID=A0ABT6ZTQ8_9ACTN|nr:hypothetical protein [Streptomyces iconiensis]MDJ1132452.1 hypothetical protein [Streptomyces iconiensis]